MGLSYFMVAALATTPNRPLRAIGRHRSCYSSRIMLVRQSIRRSTRHALVGSALAFFGVTALAAGCGSDPEPTASTAGPSGSGGGTSSGDPWAKPECTDPAGPGTGGVPLARADTAGVLTADGRRFLIFGGDIATVVCGDVAPEREHVADTWMLDTACGGWTEITGAAPPPRARHSMAYDAAGDRALVFGGRTRPTGDSGMYTLYDDVWAFDFATNGWSQITTSGTGPTPRANSAVVVAGGELIVFGGNTSTSGVNFVPMADTFALDLATGAWRSIAPNAGPPGRLFHSAAYDAETHRVYAFSGGDANAFLGPFFADLWALDLASETWVEIPTSGIADLDLGRIKGSIAFRESHDQLGGPTLFAFSGHDAGALGARNDVLALDLSSAATLPLAADAPWSTVRAGDVFNAPSNGQCDFPADFTIVDAESPERRQAFAFGQLLDGGAFVVFGGDSDCGRLNDAWWFHTGTGTWTPIRESLAGLTCPRQGNPSCGGLCG
jgi:hypothetical protein